MAAAEARNKMELATRKLRKAVSDLDGLTNDREEHRPTLAALSRKLASLNRAWQEFEDFHAAHRLLLDSEGRRLEEESKEYEDAYDIYEASCYSAEDLMQGLAVPESIEGTEEPDADELTLLLDEEQLTIKVLVNGVEKAVGGPGPFADSFLDQQMALLEEARARASKAVELCQKLTRACEPDKIEGLQVVRKDLTTGLQTKYVELVIKVAAARSIVTIVDRGGAAVNEQPRGAGAAGGSGSGQSNYFKKRPFPEFSGNKRDYPSFHKEWMQCIAPTFQQEFQLREIRRAVPKWVEPDLKNLHDMKEVWRYMDSEFGQVMEICAELVEALITFKFSSAARTEAEKFTELNRKWNEVYSDLEEIGKTDVLNHEPTLMKVCQRLPSNTSRSKYVDLRLAGLEGEKTELVIMIEFMKVERLRQKALQKLEGKYEAPVKEVGQGSGNSAKPSMTCFNCQEKGHRQMECPKKKGSNVGGGKRVANANLKLPQKPCPTCQGQHTFTNAEGEVMYMSRLSACGLFVNLSAAERANTIQAALGCALCLDWTGDHLRETCKAKKKGRDMPMCSIPVNGSPCGVKHHNLLHGAKSKFCNMVHVNGARVKAGGGGVLVSNAVEGNRAPTMEEIERMDAAQNILLQTQWLEIRGDLDQCLSFWDCGSNIHLIRSAFAKQAGLQGRPVTQYLQTTGRQSEAWQTMAYRVRLVDREGNEHVILAFAMDSITASQERVDVSKAMSLFPILKDLEQVSRAVGPVDLLLGIHQAELHPVLEGQDHVVGSLRLMSSKFGTGFLLDGTHPSISPKPVFLNADAINKGHSTLGKLIYNDREKTKVVNQVKRVRQEFNFLECEEMAVGQPRRCGSCSTCKSCSVRAQDMTRREQEELGLIENNIHVDLDQNKVMFRYPLVKDPTLLTDNRSQARAMALGLEKRLKIRNELDEYNCEMAGFVARGVLRQISGEEMSKWEGPINYVSHHGVAKPGSASTKLRIVSNSSLNNNNNGLSYNDCLPKGPNSLVPLLQALVTWRGYEEVAVWDIKKAYNSVHTYQEEMHMRRLLWRWGVEEDEWSTFGFLVMAFGDRVGTCGLEVAKQKVAKVGAVIDERVALMVEKGYVDDGCGGGDKEFVDYLIGEQTNVDGSLEYSGKVSQILALGGFKVKVMVRSGETDAKMIEKLGGGVLGLPWDPERDKIVMHMGVNLSPKRAKVRLGPELTQLTMSEISQVVITRRVVVGQVYAIYDPLGLLAPITIKFKMLLQELSSVLEEKDEEGRDKSLPKPGWDTPIVGETEERCRRMLEEIVKANNVAFPRSLKPKGSIGHPEVVGWWDGGDPASAAAIYIRYRREQKGDLGETHTVRLLAGKARVTPGSRMSTPRTEMRGLLLLARAITALLPGLVEKPAKISLLGDSQCTIASVDCQQHLLGTWFGNRVAEVIEHMRAWQEEGIEVDEIHHWPGLRNIADLGTKGKATLEEIGEDSEWQCGPKEVRFERDTWPASRAFKRQVPQEELRSKVFNVLATSGSRASMPSLMGGVAELMIKHNKLKEVQGMVARVLRANSSGNRDEVMEMPSTKYLGLAMDFLFIVASGETQEEVDKGSLTGLNPIWSCGRWVTRGRLGKGLFKILGATELPILLPSSRLARLIMEDAHNQDHKGPKSTLWRARAKAWVWRGYKLAKEVERNCRWCKAKKKKMLEQRMGDLPEDRFDLGSPPFTFVSLDLMGPVIVKGMVNKRGVMKAWPLIIVCRSTGAVHTQLMHSYGTEAFLLQWSNFVALRGAPRRVVSDRGSQLTSSENYVTWKSSEDPSKWGWKEIEERSAREGTDWEFVPSGCQWRNGLAESKVKAIKSTLAHMMASTLIGGKPTIAYAALMVVLTRAASVVNDRPLGLRSLTDDDMVAITPNQLLIGRTSTSQRVPAEEEVNDYGRSSKYQEELLNTWWNLWKIQVFPHLLPYPSYSAAKRHVDLKVGDVCLLKYEGKVRGTFQLCRVEETFEDVHKVVRTVKVKLGSRNVSKSGKPKMAVMIVGIQRLVLIQAVEDLPKDTADLSKVSEYTADLPEDTADLPKDTANIQ